MKSRVKSFILKLTEEERQEFDSLLRRNDYGGYYEALGWLKSHNVASSRTAVYRYSKGLRMRDGVTKGEAGSYSIRYQKLDVQRVRENEIQMMMRIESKLDRLLSLLEK